MISFALHPHELAALGAGRLAQVRRPIEDWPPEIRLLRRVSADWPFSMSCQPAEAGVYRPKSNKFGALCVETPDGKWLGVKPSEFEWVCPLGGPGDRLRVLHPWHHYTPPSTNPANEQAWDEWTRVVRWPHTDRVVIDCTPDVTEPGWERRPADTLPDWASRCFLEVVGVRVGRIHSYTEQDAIDMGCPQEYLASKNWLQPTWDALCPEHPVASNPWTWIAKVKETSCQS